MRIIFAINIMLELAGSAPASAFMTPDDESVYFHFKCRIAVPPAALVLGGNGGTVAAIACLHITVANKRCPPRAAARNLRKGLSPRRRKLPVGPLSTERRGVATGSLNHVTAR